MSTYLFKPDCPISSPNGFVPKEDYYAYLHLTTDSKQMMVGNKPVTIRYNADEMSATRHMANGKYYTSKKKFRQATKAAGCIEVGDQTSYVTRPKKYIPPTSRRERRESIKQAIHELKNRK